ncbi:glycoside hydrolase family 2 protein [Caenimonas aquaedulcis]|uniref:beta-mannosidase n=1 Tax=Caenimonas aquaedulcis TaxID=2793270 RepID=A0A931H4H6_9BURK|nr:glycoside hydrolase family 2 protein [Caenimonas aquaedulcis]MBG9388305.1 glycoside hydrolase family 2 protein [Caenimonas aquaedulcis]
MPRALPVAAALRERGEWSVDDAPAAFDDRTYWYRLVFHHTGAAGESTVLRFDGLATFARIWLNGEALGQSDNMFAASDFEVGPVLREGVNELMLCFDALGPQLTRRRPRPRWRVPMLQAQQLRWLRATLLGRTPGWSPPAPAVGPWRDIWLLPRDAAALARCSLEVAWDGSDGTVRCDLGNDGVFALPLTFTVEGHGMTVSAAMEAAGDATLSTQLRVPGARPWWPHTHGEPALYTATLADAKGVTLVKRRIGFRTVAIDTGEEGFELRVNGVAVFCRGAVWTPLDAVSLRAPAGDYAAAVSQLRAAGMNMLRVAGITVYEEDAFYDACDEQGVLVWQDFMFASMDYPAQDAAFAGSVEREAQQQLRRWGWRACLAVLCGNSEVEQQAAMWGALREQWRSPLFDGILPAACARHAPGVPYWPSSAHGGAVPFQADAGTTSYYGVGAYLRPLDDARRSGLRFATESLAFSNVPGDDAIARMPGGLGVRMHHPQWKARVPRDLGAGWDFEDVRDHYLRELAGVDPVRLRSTDPARYLALSRWVTGEVMAAAYSEWRRPASPCGGALVLMLRDLWAGAGWGVLDERGAPKPCWHALERVLQPRTVLLTDEGGNGLCAHAINDRPQALDAVLSVQAWQHGHVAVAQGRRELSLPPRGALSVPLLEMLDHFIDLSYAYRFGPPPCDVVAASLHDAQGVPIARALHFPAGVAPLLAQDPGLAATVRVLDARTAEVVVTAQRIALGVHFEAGAFRADREWVHVAPGEELAVVLRSAADAPLHCIVHALNAAAPVQPRR